VSNFEQRLADARSNISTSPAKGFCLQASVTERPVGAPACNRWRCPMSKSAEYREKAGEHVQLAARCESPEVRQIHADMARSFLALANDEDRGKPWRDQAGPRILVAR
jgi:hypothetical protein